MKAGPGLALSRQDEDARWAKPCREPVWTPWLRLEGGNARVCIIIAFFSNVYGLFEVLGIRSVFRGKDSSYFDFRGKIGGQLFDSAKEAKNFLTRSNE
jgi:hypothetical protein